MLDGMGWNPSSGRSAINQMLGRLERGGLVFSTEVEFESPDGAIIRDRNWVLTRRGFEVWCRYYDFAAAITEQFGDTRRERADLDFVALDDAPPRTKREPKVERAPTRQEQQQILEAAGKDFQRVYEFAILVNARPVDLINARIESVDLDRWSLRLEAVAASGRPIEERDIDIPPKARDILVSAISGRTSGVIFLRGNKTPWTVETMSQAFRRLRQKLGLDPEIALSGRGGHLAPPVEKSRSTLWED